MFKVTIFKKNIQVMSLEASSVAIPSEEEELTILPFHSPILARLTAGILKIDDKEFSINDGIARFFNNELLVIVE